MILSSEIHAPIKSFYSSPVGTIELKSEGESLTSLIFSDSDQSSSLVLENTLLHQIFSQLDDYFAGNLTSFNIPMEPAGTDFQKEVWKFLQTVPFGQTMSYMEMSKQMGDPKKIRAIANANAKNPISILIPCHRIIGSDGSLTGYAGGLHRKKWLLEHEQKVKQLSMF